jgi:hypothetical protein
VRPDKTQGKKYHTKTCDYDTCTVKSMKIKNSRSGSSGHAGGTRPGQTRKKPKDLSAREGEERGRGGDGGVYAERRRKPLTY